MVPPICNPYIRLSYMAIPRVTDIHANWLATPSTNENSPGSWRMFVAVAAVGCCCCWMLLLLLLLPRCPSLFSRGLAREPLPTPQRNTWQWVFCVLCFFLAPLAKTRWCERERQAVEKSKPKFAFYTLGKFSCPSMRISLSLSLSLSPSLSVFPCVCAPVVLGGFRIPSAAHPLLATHLVPPISAPPPKPTCTCVHWIYCQFYLLSLLLLLLLALLLCCYLH